MSSDPINEIAGRLRLLINSLFIDEECEYCKKFFGDQETKCRGFSWDMTFFTGIDNEGGYWNFSLRLHKKEILYTTTYGTITQALMDAYKKVVEFKLAYNNKIIKR